MEQFNWHERADERDGKAQKIADAKAVQEQAVRLKRQRQAGELMQTRGVEYLSKNEIKHERTALVAIKAGIDVQRQADGLPDWIIAIINLKADELPTIADEISAEIERRAIERRGTDSPEFGDESEDAK